MQDKFLKTREAVAVVESNTILNYLLFQMYIFQRIKSRYLSSFLVISERHYDTHLKHNNDHYNPTAIKSSVCSMPSPFHDRPDQALV